MVDVRPFLFIIPGSSQNPAHYGYLSHLLLEASYPVYCGSLPSTGSAEETSQQEDAEAVRKTLLFLLDHEERDVIIVMHSSSGVPGSAAALGLSKKERAVQGHRTGVAGQIFISALLMKGGDGQTFMEAFGGQLPPHIREDVSKKLKNASAELYSLTIMNMQPATGLLRCDERKEPLCHDVTPALLQDSVAVACVSQSKSSFASPCPRASWDSNAFAGRIAFVRTLKDRAMSPQIQQMMIDGSGVEWQIKDIDTSHSPQLAQPKLLATILVEIADRWGAD